MKWATNKRLHMEIGVIKAIQSLNDARISDVITALAGVHDLSGTMSEEKTAPAKPSEKKTEPSPPPTPQKKEKKTDEVAGGLDRLIDEAEEGSSEIEVPVQTAAKPSPTEPEPPEAETVAPEASTEDDFQKDPLIQQAMDTFQASRIS
jgi:DNA polymerase-3 subunit gamma/tau